MPAAGSSGRSPSSGGGAAEEVDAISGATVTSLVLNDVILGAARAVARAKGLLGAPGGIDTRRLRAAHCGRTPARTARGPPLCAVADADRLLAAHGGQSTPPGDPDDLFLELSSGLASAARIGGNLVGMRTLERTAAEFGAGDPCSSSVLAAAGR